MNTHEAIRTRIRKLLNLADGSDHEGEIENALRLAQQLMDDHQLTRAEILDDPDNAEAIAGERMERQAAAGGGVNLAAWEGRLALAVCQALGSVQIYTSRQAAVRSSVGLSKGNLRTGNARPGTVCQFYGIAEDVALAVELFSDTRTTIAAMSRLKYGGVYRGPGRSYCEGFVSALHRRTETQAAERSAQCTAIVLCSAKKAVAWLAKAHDVKLRKTSGGQGGQHFTNSYGEGKADGQRCGFSSNRHLKLTGGSAVQLPG